MAFTPSARPRSSGGKACVIMAMLTAKISAAPEPLEGAGGEEPGRATGPPRTPSSRG